MDRKKQLKEAHDFITHLRDTLIEGEMIFFDRLTGNIETGAEDYIGDHKTFDVIIELIEDELTGTR